MKKLLKSFYLLLAIITASVTFTSCSDDEENVPSGNSSIIGKWEVADQIINGHKGTLQVEFKSNKKGTISALYTDGTDPDSYNFEYVLKEEENGDIGLTIVWTGSHTLIYKEGTEYNITITPSRLVWGKYTYTRK